MCVGAVEPCEKSCNFREISLISHKDDPYRRCVLVTCGQTDLVGFVVPH